MSILYDTLRSPNVTDLERARKRRNQRLYKASLSSKTCDLQPLTAEDSKLRFADAVIDLKRNRLITVCEDHSKEGEAVNTISSVGVFQLCVYSSVWPTQHAQHCSGVRKCV